MFSQSRAGTRRVAQPPHVLIPESVPPPACKATPGARGASHRVGEASPAPVTNPGSEREAGKAPGGFVGERGKGKLSTQLLLGGGCRSPLCSCCGAGGGGGGQSGGGWSGGGGVGGGGGGGGCGSCGSWSGWGCRRAGEIDCGWRQPGRGWQRETQTLAVEKRLRLLGLALAIPNAEHGTMQTWRSFPFQNRGEQGAGGR